MPSFILSPCGTSLLTNEATDDQRRVISRIANRKLRQITVANKIYLSVLLEKVKSKLKTVSPKEAAQKSAEINAIARFYDFQFSNHTRDHHVLLTTDTWLGEVTGDLVKGWLKNLGFSVEVIKQTDLQTADLNLYKWALADLVRWCGETIPEYKDAGYHIVFNLTGGFKSVQGFLQTLAMLYADEAVYVFESQTELFRLPRLPLKLDPDETIKKHFALFRKIDLGLPEQIPPDLPELFFLKLDESIVLSDYGQILFQQIKKNLYEQKVHHPVYDKVKFTDSFLRSVSGLEAKRKRIINERIEDLTKYLLSGRTQKINRLDFKALQGNPKPPSTHEIDAWADQDAIRIFGHFEDDIFVIDILDKALH